MKSGVGAPRAGFPSLIQEDGTYEIGSIPAGQVRIAVHTRKPPAGKRRPSSSKELPADTEEEAKRDIAFQQRKFVQVPEIYGDAEKSGLTLKITGGTQTFDIKLPAVAKRGK